MQASIPSKLSPPTHEAYTRVCIKTYEPRQPVRPAYSAIERKPCSSVVHAAGNCVRLLARHMAAFGWVGRSEAGRKLGFPNGWMDSAAVDCVHVYLCESCALGNPLCRDRFVLLWFCLGEKLGNAAVCWIFRLDYGSNGLGIVSWSSGSWEDLHHGHDGNADLVRDHRLGFDEPVGDGFALDGVAHQGCVDWLDHFRSGAGFVHVLDSGNGTLFGGSARIVLGVCLRASSLAFHAGWSPTGT